MVSTPILFALLFVVLPAVLCEHGYSHQNIHGPHGGHGGGYAGGGGGGHGGHDHYHSPKVNTRFESSG